ncbi:MAG: hypothetical protein L6R36_005819 [Xanthoria steineri]|nr:MAG: hypothetical protein L6R36_005819 [Xanthoria steineri]
MKAIPTPLGGGLGEQFRREVKSHGRDLQKSPAYTERYGPQGVREHVNPDIFGPNGRYAQISNITGFRYNSRTAVGPRLVGTLEDAGFYGNMKLVTPALLLLTALVAF